MPYRVFFCPPWLPLRFGAAEGPRDEPPGQPRPVSRQSPTLGWPARLYRVVRRMPTLVGMGRAGAAGIPDPARRVLPFVGGRSEAGFLCDEGKCGLELDRAPRPRRPLTLIHAGFSGRLTSAAVGLGGGPRG